MREHCGVNVIAKSPQTIGQSLVAMLLISGIIGLLVAVPEISSEVGVSAFAERWSSMLYSRVSQTVWSFLGIAAAIIIALQLAVRDGDRRAEPRLQLRRQILAFAAMFVGAFVLDALLLTAMAPDQSTNLPLVVAAGGILVFMAAEAGTALVVPSVSAINQEKVERYTKARASTKKDPENSVRLFPGRYLRLRLYRAQAVTACACTVPTLILWVFSGELSSLPAGGLFVFISAVIQVVTVQTILVIVAPGLALETRAFLAIFGVVVVIVLIGLLVAAIQLQAWQLVVGFGWSLFIAILSAANIRGHRARECDLTIGRAFGRLHDNWLGLRIDRLSLKPLVTSLPTEIEAIRAWLTAGKQLPGGFVEAAPRGD